MTGLIIVAKLLGFVKQMVVAAVYGATAETDLINLSQQFISNIQYVLVQALSTSFVSLYIHLCIDDGKNARKFLNNTIVLLLIVTVVSSTIVSFFSSQIAKVLAPAYSTEMQERLAFYIAIYSPLLIFFGIIAIFQAILNSNKKFIPSEMVSIFQSVITIVLVWLLFRSFGTKILAISIFFYTIWNLFYLYLLTKKFWDFSFSNPFKNPEIKQLEHMILPLILGYSLVYVNQQVDKILVTGLDEGTVTSLTYASVLSNLVGTFIVTFGSIIFSYITSSVAAGDDRGAAQITNESTILFSNIFMPISMITFIYSRDIVNLVFGRGNFDEKAVETTSIALAGYAVSFVPLVFREMYSRYQYSYKDTKTPMINSSIGIVCNIVLSIILCKFYGVWGVTFATSISVIVCAGLNILTAWIKHRNSLGLRTLIHSLPRSLIAIISSLVIYVLLNRILNVNSMFKFIIIAVMVCLMYYVFFIPDIVHLIKHKR